MFREGTLSVQEADRLVEAVTAGSAGMEKAAPGRSGRRYLRVQVDQKPNAASQEKVNIRVPMKLIRAGIKLARSCPGTRKAR